MASTRIKRDKQYEQLVNDSDKLHKDIDELKAAYILHKHIVQEDQTGVRGIIRRELGSSRWEHGGVGKLHNYKSSTDLCTDKKQKAAHRTDNECIKSNDTRTSVRENVCPNLDQSERHSKLNVIENNMDSDRILDLKTKVLRKASSKIIKRDSWFKPCDVDKHVAVAKHRNAELHDQAVEINSAKKRVCKTVNTTSSTSEEFSQHSQNIKCDNTSVSAKHKRDSSKQNRPEPSRKSRIDMYDNGRRKQAHETSVNLENVIPFSDSSVCDMKDTYLSQTACCGSHIPRGLVSPHTDRASCDMTRTKLFTDCNQNSSQTEYLQGEHIDINTKIAEVNINSNDQYHMYKDALKFSDTRVVSQQNVVNKSVEGYKPYSIDGVELNSSSQNETKDIFGLENMMVLSRAINSTVKGVTSSSALAQARQCNTEVEFWLRSLGLSDVEMCVKMFAEHKIDSNDIEFLSAAQLHDMGISTVGTIDKILKAVKDLKSVSINDDKETKPKQIRSSSLNWDGQENIHKLSSKRKTENTCKVISENNIPCDNDQTVIKSLLEFGDNTNREETESLCTGRSPYPSFTSSTIASCAKCVQKRPPSIKDTIKEKVSKKNCQSHATINQSQTNLSRKCNDKAFSKLNNLESLESKPTKGVLLHSRSSSLSRNFVKKGQEDKDNKPSDKRKIKKRSRSVDVVKKKALEGVQTAAKRYEEKSNKTKDIEKVCVVRANNRKSRRDEMAARHLQREKFKEMNRADSSDLDEGSVHEQPSSDSDQSQSLKSLVTVNILSPHKNSVHCDENSSSTVIYVLPPINPRKSPFEDQMRTQKKADVHQSVRRSHPVKKHIRDVPVLSTYKLNTKDIEKVQSEAESGYKTDVPPFLSTYKLNTKDTERVQSEAQSEPESGYKTDGNTTYSVIEDRVSDIQLQIKRLKARATIGDDMTLTLVHDLQEQLQRFEKQLTEKEKELRPGFGKTYKTYYNESGSVPKPVPRKSIVNAGEYHQRLLVDESNPRSDIQVEEKLVTGVRMSKQDLLDEMSKEKQQHQRQIRQLQSELHRMRHTDPLAGLELNPNDVLFSNEELIGEGTFSCVYKGQYRGAEVAVKQLKVPLKQQDITYFAAEVNLLKELCHPRVVLLLGVCTTSNLPFLVLEYMPCGSLHKYLHSTECDYLDHALYYQIARDVAAGMNYLHSHKPEVLHLDLKSMNVLLCRSLRAKIADFGFSKLRLDAGIKLGTKSKKTFDHTSVFWMSPELLDKREITGKADVYSFGIILWEMITRKMPYANCSVFQVLERVKKNQRPKIPASTPHGLHSLISACWDSNPAKRPHFKDILDTLENLEFPPTWRELFQKAGVPESALQNVHSTRIIIGLVSGTLDQEHNVKVQTHKHETDDSVKTINLLTQSTNNNFKPRNDKLSITNSMESVRTTSINEERWDSKSVSKSNHSTPSDDTEFTLKNLRDSSSDGSNENTDRSDSSILSNDDDFFGYGQSQTTEIKKSVNVHIPNLELSLQTSNEDFIKNRMSQESDWSSVSLGDRTCTSADRTVREVATQAEIRDDNEEAQVNHYLSTTQTERIDTAVNKKHDGFLNVNESARTRTNKSFDLVIGNGEFLRRDSFHNRRPQSLKKNTSLMKQSIDNLKCPLADENVANCDLHSKLSPSQSYHFVKSDSARVDTKLEHEQVFRNDLPFQKEIKRFDSPMFSCRSQSTGQGSEEPVLTLKLKRNISDDLQVVDIESDRCKVVKKSSGENVGPAYEEAEAYDTQYQCKAGYERTRSQSKSNLETKSHKQYSSATDWNHVYNALVESINFTTKDKTNQEKLIQCNLSNIESAPDIIDKQEELTKAINLNKDNKPLDKVNTESVRVVLNDNYSRKTYEAVETTQQIEETIDRERKLSKLGKCDVEYKQGNTEQDIQEEQVDWNIYDTSSKQFQILVNKKEPLRVKLNIKEVNELQKRPIITPRRSKLATNTEDKQLTSSMVHLNQHEVKQSKLSSQINTDIKNITLSNEQISLGDFETCPSPPKNTIRVKLRKDPLATKLSWNSASEPQMLMQSSQVPPAPPPPVSPVISKSVSSLGTNRQNCLEKQVSMADELKSKLENRQSISQGMLSVPKIERKPVEAIKDTTNGFTIVSKAERDSIIYRDNSLVPQQSEGLPSFVVNSVDLKEQKEQLRSISKPHPDQLDDLSNVSQEQLSSITDILRKAVMVRRLAMGEDVDSVSQSLESATTGWSVDTG